MGYYDKKCNELIEEYGLIRNDFIDSVQIHNIILGLLQQKCLKGRIALWGADIITPLQVMQLSF